MGSLEHHPRFWTCIQLSQLQWSSIVVEISMILSLPEIFVLCWHIMKFGIYMWTGRASGECVKFFFEIQNLVSQVRCVSFGLLLWTMCISVFFYCGGCRGRSNGLITRKLGFKYLTCLSSPLEGASAILSFFYC